MTAVGTCQKVMAPVSLVIGVVPYMLTAGLMAVAYAVRHFGFYGLDVFVYSVAVIVLCPIVGLWLGVGVLYLSDRSGVGRPAKQLVVTGLALNGFNLVVLFVLSLCLR